MNARSWKQRSSVLLTLVGLTLCAGFVLDGAPPSAGAAEWESEELKVIVRIPADPAPWSWLPAGAQWAKYGIVRGATRELEKLKDGKAANGEHALVHLIVRDIKERDLETTTAVSLAEDDDTREMLMGRFGESEDDWPDVVSDETTLGNDVPVVILIVEGNALNTKTNEHMPCKARLIVGVANGKAYYLRMYAWHTEYDEEGLEIDLDMIETDFEILGGPKKPPTERPPEEGPPEENPDDPPAEDEEVEEEIQLREYQMRFTKHAKLTLGEADEAEGLILKLEGSDQYGYYSIYVYASKNGRVVDGRVAPPEDIKKWITTDWWKVFTANHPEGELYTFKWPSLKAPTFLTLPDISEEARKHIAGGRKKTPVEPKASDMMKKMKCVEKVKKNLIGKKYKVIEPYRGILQGKRPRRGVETMCRFAWRTVNYSFRMFVLVGGKGDEKWGDAIRATVESIRFYKD